MPRIVYIVAAVIVALWFVGLIFRYIISPIVNLLVLAALVVLAYRLFQMYVTKQKL